ncbi:hypothetical protein B0T16DRAFT_400717 [Cercophora newfieldiana]|uniref:Uncharacterized protein n=1 Tax=Cercophora newfieldiana TaxID=92897 RepID=A0AA39YST8_9PEZI|nr:hypothetical protein B0T16DRAFT_400717 [Cercophora newfieldiana]
MAGCNHTVDMMTLEVPYPTGRVSWAHGETENNIRVFFEPFNEADPNHHRPPQGSVPSRSTTSSCSSDFGSQPRSQVAPTTAHVAPYLAEDEYPYTSDEDDDTSTQNTDMDHLTTPRGDNRPGSNFASVETPPTSVNSDPLAMMQDHLDDIIAVGHTQQLVWPRRDTVDLGVGAWLPAHIDRPTDVPQNLREVAMVGIREDPASKSIEDILNMVERNRDEMYVERFRRVAQS